MVAEGFLPTASHVPDLCGMPIAISYSFFPAFAHVCLLLFC